MATTITMKRGDRRPYLEAILAREATGGLVSLVGATVALAIKPKAGGAAVVRAAEIVDAAAAHVRYAWQSADTATAGDYDLEWEVKYADATRETVPADGYDLLRVVADLGDAA